MQQPLRVCAFPRCPVRVPRGYCAAHQPTRAESRRPTDPRYGTMQWRRYSRQRLSEHPWCERPGCDELATCTHHVEPVSVAPDRFWDESNHISACRRCNRQAEADHTRRGTVTC
jgi:hypothetical protein